MLLVYHYSVLLAVSEGGNYCPVECVSYSLLYESDYITVACARGGSRGSSTPLGYTLFS